MSVEVKIPAVGESITSGLISSWHKQNGDSVEKGDVLLTLETDKVSTEITAEQAGMLSIKVPEGQEVKIGEVVAVIEDRSAPARAKPAESKGEELPEREQTTIGGKDTAAPEPEAAEPAIAREAKPAVESEPQPERIFESALRYSPPEVNETTGEPVSDGRTTRRRLSPLRRKIAAQLVMAQHTAAILTTFNECDMTEVMRLRKEMQDEFQQRHGLKLGFMSFFVKAVVSALKAVPAVNGSMDGEDFVQHHYYDIGVAVGTERGLIVPVIRDADQKSFADVERDIAEYAAKARDGKIKIEDLQGGVFTISNGGVYGSLLSTPILNPPQSGILGMHKIQERPMAINGAVVIRPMMYLAMSYDHRIVDGKEAVSFLIRVKECVETPPRLMFDV